MHIFLFAIGFGAMFVVGCGSSTESDGSSSTKKQFVAKASGICHQAENEELQLIGLFSKSHPKADDEEELVEPAFVPAAEKMIEDLAALGTPSGDKSAVEGIVKALEDGLAETKKEPRALLSPDTNPFKEADKLAREYGVKACSYVP